MQEHLQDMIGAIEKKVSQCALGNKFRMQKQRESLKPHEIPDYPWSEARADQFDVNRILTLITRLLLHNTLGSNVIRHCELQF